MAGRYIQVTDADEQVFSWIPANTTEYVQAGPLIDVRGMGSFVMSALPHALRMGAGTALVLEAYGVMDVSRDLRFGVGGTPRQSITLTGVTPGITLDPGGYSVVTQPYIRIWYKATQPATAQMQFGGIFSIGLNLIEGT